MKLFLSISEVEKQHGGVGLVYFDWHYFW